MAETGPGKNAILPINMWWTQLPISLALVYFNVLALGEAKPKAK